MARQPKYLDVYEQTAVACAFNINVVEISLKHFDTRRIVAADRAPWSQQARALQKARGFQLDGDPLCNLFEQFLS